MTEGHVADQSNYHEPIRSGLYDLDFAEPQNQSDNTHPYNSSLIVSLSTHNLPPTAWHLSPTARGRCCVLLHAP